MRRASQNRKSTAIHSAAAVRPGGMTLAEVLMSIFVTAIGIMSVVALLQASFVRSVQATNLTNGTILRFNAESQIALDKLDLENVFPTWQPGTAYVGAASPGPGGPVTPPSFVLSNAATNNLRFRCSTTGISGVTEPAWNTTIGGNTPDGTAAWTTEDHSHYVIDPLGWNVFAASSTTNTLQGTLGNNRGTAGTIGAAVAGQPPPSGIERFNAGINAGGNTGSASSVAAAAQLVTLPDSWVGQWNGPVASVSATPVTSITINGPDLSNVGFSTPGPVPALTTRVVLTDSTGKVSQTRLVTNITSPASNPTISWAATDPLTGTFTPAQVRLESQERRYTWLLTVRRSSGGIANMDVVVFFHRSLIPDDEQTYSATGSGAQFTVTYGSSPKPFLKKGGFLFDVSFGRWYRVLDIQNDNGTQFTAIVDRSRPATEAAISQTFNVVFMRGIVQVYSLGNK